MKRSKYKKLRTIEEIKLEIYEFKERYRRHIAWNERNRLFFETRKKYCSDIEKKIKEIDNSPNSFKKIFGLFRRKRLKDDVLLERDILVKQLKEAENLTLNEVPVLEFPFEQYPNNRNMYSDWTWIPKKLEKELEVATKLLEKKQKLSNLKSRVANADEKTRMYAQTIIRKLDKDHSCPYCGNSLGNNPHADHIQFLEEVFPVYPTWYMFVKIVTIKKEIKL